MWFKNTSRFWEKAIKIKAIKTSIDNGFNNFSIFSAISEWYCLISIPKNNGIPNINETNFNKSTQFNSTVFKISWVGSYKLPQNCKLNGVITMQINVEKAVKLTDKAAFPPAILLKKLESNFEPNRSKLVVLNKLDVFRGRTSVELLKEKSHVLPSFKTRLFCKRFECKIFTLWISYNI